MSAINHDVKELTAAVRDKLIAHANDFQAHNSQEKPEDTYQHRSMKVINLNRDRLPKAQAFSYTPESHVIAMVAENKMPCPTDTVVNPSCRYANCPAYIDPLYYEIGFPKEQDSARVSSNWKLYLHAVPGEKQISVLGDDNYRFAIDFHYEDSDFDYVTFGDASAPITIAFLKPAFVEQNSVALRDKIIAAKGELVMMLYERANWDSQHCFKVVNLPEILRAYSSIEPANCRPLLKYLYAKGHLKAYNVNQILPNVFVGEGPTDGTLALSTMLHGFMIDNVIAISAPGGTQKFFDYIGHRGADGKPFTVWPDHHKFSCYHMNDWPDYGVCNHRQQLETALEIVRNASKSQRVFIHCSAGLGRAGVLVSIIALARSLREQLPPEILKKLETNAELSSEESTELAAVIAENVIALRKIRPGLIQNEAQLQQTLEMTLWEVKKQAELKEKKTDGLSIQNLSTQGYFSSPVPQPVAFPPESAASIVPQKGPDFRL